MQSKWIAMAIGIAVGTALIIWFLGQVGVVTAILWDVLLLLMGNWEQVGGVVAFFYKTLRRLSFMFEKNAVAKRLEFVVGLASKRVNRECGDILPHGIDVKWVELSKRDAFLKEGKIVVCLEASDNEDRNLAQAMLFFVSEDLIRESQRFIDPNVMKSLIFSVARKMLMADNRIGALKRLNTEFIEPEVEKRAAIRAYVLAMDKMDEQGRLTRILLNEFSQLGPRLAPALSDERSQSESKTFFGMLDRFENKGKDEDVPLEHNGDVIRAHLLPVARLDTFSPNSFVDRTSQDYQNRVDTIYVLARGGNVGLAKYVVEEVEKKKLYSVHGQHDFRISRKAGEGITASYVAILTRTAE